MKLFRPPVLFCLVLTQILLSAFTSYSQTTLKIVDLGFNVVKSYLDSRGVILLIDDKGNLSSYDDQLNKLNTYQEKIEIPDYISDINGMQYFLFYKQAQKAIVLDRRLSKKIKIDLGNNGYACAALAGNGAYWGFTPQEMLISKRSFDNQIQVDLDFRGKFPPNPQVFMIREYSNLLILGEVQSGIWFLSLTGEIIERITLEDINEPLNYSIHKQKLYCWDAEHILQANIDTNSSKRFTTTFESNLNKTKLSQSSLIKEEDSFYFFTDKKSFLNSYK